MKKIIVSLLLNLIAMGCIADPNTQPTTTETESPTEYFRLVHVNVVQAALAPVAENFDWFDGLYRSHKQQVEEYVARQNLTPEEIKAADTLLQQMREEWLMRLKVKHTQHTIRAEEAIKQAKEKAEKEVTASHIKTVFSKVEKFLNTKPKTTGYHQRDGEYNLSGKELQAALKKYSPEMKKVETYLANFIKNHSLSEQDMNKALALLQKAAYQAQEAQMKADLDTFSF